jgi:hypothetical protein
MSEPLIMGGYIILSRNIIESQIWHKPPLYLKVWIYLLSKAQHADYKQLKRGQLYISIPKMQEDLSYKVGFRLVKPTKDQIFDVIDWLRSFNQCVGEATPAATMKAPMITTAKATHGLLVSIDKYDVYQNSKNYESNGENNNESSNEAPGVPNNINKNDKNDIYIAHFNQFWDSYPRKVSKSVALKVFNKLKVDGVMLTKMLGALEVQKQSKQWQDKQFIPHPNTWLNQRRWEDECEDDSKDSLSVTADGTFKL